MCIYVLNITVFSLSLSLFLRTIFFLPFFHLQYFATNCADFNINVITFCQQLHNHTFFFLSFFLFFLYVLSVAWPIRYFTQIRSAFLLLAKDIKKTEKEIEEEKWKTKIFCASDFEQKNNNNNKKIYTWEDNKIKK